MSLLASSSQGSRELRPPAFFEAIRDRAHSRWSQLEKDPELAGPWRQLFNQIQCPRHVISELLQNADDAGAECARVSIVDGSLIFEHNGEDFTKEQFSSLCSFGFSNKQKLHTIGFRGLGFKSTFSLGAVVKVMTPSLAVCFHKHRFTEPIWIDDATPSGITRISVEIQDSDRENELRKNMEEWIRSPASLLFFSNIRELTIGEDYLRREALGEGPVAGSQRIKLIGHAEHDLLLLRSKEEAFPCDAIKEVREERWVEDFNLPPCGVELVIGLPGEQRLYVVLPTGVTIQMPFSCNAPFLQDPARASIKSPSVSPTNRWLLNRLGNLAGSAMLAWLDNSSLSINDRAAVYCLLPERQKEADSVETDVSLAISESFMDAINDQSVMLTTEGRLAKGNETIGAPMGAYDVWAPSELLILFGDEESYVLTDAVSTGKRTLLLAWSKFKCFDNNELIKRLASKQQIPRPKTNERLAALWNLVQKEVRYDYDGSKRRRLCLVPVAEADVLLPANEVVRLSTKKQTISEKSKAYLTTLVSVVDRRWIEFLSSDKSDSKVIESARQLLSDLLLDSPSDVNTVIAIACRTLFSRGDITIGDCVRIAHLMAELDASTPEEFRCVTRDGQLRKPSEGVIGLLDASLEDIFPSQWIEAHFLHEDYFSNSLSSGNRQQWHTWLCSKKSKFYPFVKLDKTFAFHESRELENRVIDFLRERGSHEDKLSFYCQVIGVDVFDYGFEDELLQHWMKLSAQDPAIWARIMRRILEGPSWYWADCTEAKLYEYNYTHDRRLCSPVTAEWIIHLSGTKCLCDTQEKIRMPAELYLRTPDTEPLMDVEPFVRSELDNETTKPLLLKLGVRDTQAGIDKLLGRIRMLAGVPDPSALLSEIIKWYRALDKALARCSLDDLQQVRSAFKHEQLILTSTDDWADSAEVFRYASEDDLPDAPIVHPSVQDLAMWTRIEVADRPSAELVLDWLKGLDSRRTLSPTEVKRIRGVLQRYPNKVWETIQHWLTLDNAWTPVDEIQLRLTMRGLTKWSALFPAVKARTANLQMLRDEVCDRLPFSALPDLGKSIEYRLTKPPRNMNDPVKKSWAVAFARGLLRARFDDEAQTNHVHEVAIRLEHSFWQSGGTINVAPYIDGTPAGAPYSPEVFWHEQTIYVPDMQLARSFSALVSELGAPFRNDKIAEAMKACIERDPDFIAAYMAQHFEMDADSVKQPDTPAKAPESDEALIGTGFGPEDKSTPGIIEEDGRYEPLDGETIADDDDEDEVYLTDTGIKKRKKPSQEPSLFNRYAAAKGYNWDSIFKRFTHPDGSRIERCESPFNWVRIDGDGNEACRYWASKQCLVNGVEIPAELWELIREDPEGCCLILTDANGRIRELTGQIILKMLNDKVIQLYPAKYRLREGSSL